MIKRVTLKMQAYNYLKNEILEGRIAPGVVYSEQRFADELSISRTPVRDAILQLAHEGFVKIHPNKGISVKEFSYEDVRQFFQLRSAIEGYCGMYAAERINTEEGAELIKRLEGHLEEEKRIMEVDVDSKKFMAEDAAFHMEITDFCKNEEISEIMLNLRGKIERIGVIGIARRNSFEKTHSDHMKIVEAIKSGDKLNVLETINRHIEWGQDIFVK